MKGLICFIIGIFFAFFLSFIMDEIQVHLNHLQLFWAIVWCFISYFIVLYNFTYFISQQEENTWFWKFRLSKLHSEKYFWKATLFFGANLKPALESCCNMCCDDRGYHHHHYGHHHGYYATHNDPCCYCCIYTTSPGGGGSGGNCCFDCCCDCCCPR